MYQVFHDAQVSRCAAGLRNVARCLKVAPSVVAIDNELAVRLSLRMATKKRSSLSARISPPDASSATLLREVARLHVRAQRATLACAGAGTTQCTILTELGRAPSMTLAELSRRLRIDKGWTSRAIEQLVQEGLVAKKDNEADRRVVALSLTSAGSAQRRRLEAVLDGQVASVMSRLPGHERPAVARALKLLHDAYVAELADHSADSLSS